MKRKVTALKFLFLSFLLFTLMVVVQPVSIQAAADTNLSKAQITVTVNIPVFQKIDILEKRNIDYSLLMKNYNGSQEIILKNVLVIKVMSNTNWNLKLRNDNINSNLMIKRTDQSNSKWQKLNSAAKFSGRNGVELINFDLKLLVDQDLNRTANDFDLDLRCSIDPSQKSFRSNN